MDIQKWYDIIWTINLVGKNDIEKIKKSILLRTGKRENPLNIIKLYNEIIEYIKNKGYKNPLDFLKDNFHGKYIETIKINNCNLNNNKQIILNNNKNIEIQDKKKNENNKINKNNDLQENLNIEKEKIINKDIIEKPDKINENFNSTDISIIIPTDIKNKIIKNKKSLKYYREMSIKERELDNKYDYILINSQKNDSGNFFQDNRGYLNKFPLIGKMFNDIDLQFRRIMDEIYNKDKKIIKNKNQWIEEIDILTQYFKNKLNIDEEDNLLIKRLGIILANLMQKLQFKIFETEDIEITRLLLNFKIQLGVFYSYYRK